MKFSGIVKKHLGRGKTLGFPTANIEVPKDLENGLYVGWANQKPSLIFIGNNETFGETERVAEIYLLDFDADIYGQNLEVETLQKIREVIKFSDSEDLVAQMKRDEKVARDFFKAYNIKHEQ